MLTQRTVVGFGFVLATLHASAGNPVINQKHKLLDSNGAAEDRFGRAITIHNQIIVVGAVGADINGTFSGIAHTFDALSGQHITKLLPNDGAEGDAFGASVAIENNLVVVGAPEADDPETNSGSAYVFNALTGNQLFKLHPIDASAGDDFGSSVSIQGGLIAVGANNANSVAADYSGVAYIFDASTGLQITKLTPNDPIQNARFGESTAIQGNIVAVGARTIRSAYLFDASTGQQLHKLQADDETINNSWFGNAIAIHNGVVAVGSFRHDHAGSGSGAVYLFDIKTGQQLHELIPDDSASWDQFGISVDFDSGIVAIGSSADDDNGNASGSAYLFDAESGQQLAKLLPSDGGPIDGFGNSIAIEGGVVAVGSQRDDDKGNNAGAAYIFEHPFTQCPPDLTGDGSLDFFDVSAFLTAFANQDPVADFTNDGLFDFFDVSAFLTAFAAGCP